MARKREKLSIVTIAAELGISPATVSRVVNNRTGVSEEKRRLVLKKLHEYDFRTNYPAQRKPRVAIVNSAPVFSHYHAEVLNGIFRYMQEHELTPCMIIYDGSGDETLLELLRDQQCSGVILMIPAEFSNELPELAASGLPVMQVDEATDMPNVGYIDNDSYSGSRIATEYLLSLGHREILYYTTGLRTLNHNQRRKAYEDALKGAGLTPHVLEAQADYESLKRSLKQHPEATAVMTTNDDVAQIAVKAAADLGLRVPDDLSVVGFDDYPMSRYLCPALTTVSHLNREAGRRAAESIDRYLQSNGKVPLLREVLPTGLVIRDSAGTAKNFKR